MTHTFQSHIMFWNHKTGGSAFCNLQPEYLLFFSAWLFSLADCSPSTSYVVESGCDARYTSALPSKRITASNRIDLAIEWRWKISRNPLFTSSGFAYLLLYGISSPLSMSLRDFFELPSLQESASQIWIRKHCQEAASTHALQSARR